MPIYLDRVPCGHDLLKYAKVLCGKWAEDFRWSTPNYLDIGIINNMPDEALESTERQLLTLLDTAADGLSVCLTFYALPEIPRSDSGRRHVSGFYSRIEELWDRRLDGLIVTGAEPRSPSLVDEPYWSSLTAVLDWAEHNTYSAVWSCLAAHAAVLHLDGIGRRRLREKCFGLFECGRASDHPLMAGLASRVLMPHSRWNDLPEEELAESGYWILTRSAEAGVDAFIKQRKSLFILFQGHPEYEANTLLLEYRRDIGRYLRGERDVYPTMPRGCFDQETVDLFTALAQEAMHDRREELLGKFPAVPVQQLNAWPWRTAAASIYTNWLAYLYGMKHRPLKECRPETNRELRQSAF
jgi:homoserine O-succinyltransferase